MITSFVNAITSNTFQTIAQNTDACVKIETGLKAVGRPAFTLMDKNTDKDTRKYAAVKEFLYQLGCANKKSSQYKLTLAGLLMFGYEREITEILPNYFLDYREKDTTLNSERWSHRIISSDGSWSGNLYDFYFKIINRLTSDLAVPFKLNNSIRSDNTPIHDAIREALTNTLIHADFRESGSILIEKTDNTFTFTNPGNLRIPKERALKGR